MIKVEIVKTEDGKYSIIISGFLEEKNAKLYKLTHNIVEYKAEIKE